MHGSTSLGVVGMGFQKSQSSMKAEKMKPTIGSGYRIHYKNNFKTVEQIAHEAINNIQIIKASSASPFDFSLREHLPNTSSARSIEVDSSKNYFQKRSAKKAKNSRNRCNAAQVTTTTMLRENSIRSNNSTKNLVPHPPRKMNRNNFTARNSDVDNVNDMDLKLNSGEIKDDDNDVDDFEEMLAMNLKNLKSEVLRDGQAEQQVISRNWRKNDEGCCYYDQNSDRSIDSSVNRQLVRVEMCKRPFTARNYSAGTTKRMVPASANAAAAAAAVDVVVPGGRNNAQQSLQVTAVSMKGSQRPPTAAARSYSPSQGVRNNNGSPVAAGVVAQKQMEKSCLNSNSLASNELIRAIVPDSRMEILNKWNRFFEETDRNLLTYEQEFQNRSISRKHSNGVTAINPSSSMSSSNTGNPSSGAGTRNNNNIRPMSSGSTRQMQNGSIHNHAVAGLAVSRVSSANQFRMNEQTIQVDITRMGGLLRSELNLGFEVLNLKQGFICEKLMELLLSSVNTSPKEIIADVFTVSQNYMYVSESEAIARIAQYIDINAQTKRHLYREVCEKLEARLAEVLRILDNERENLLNQCGLTEQLRVSTKEEMKVQIEKQEKIVKDLEEQAEQKRVTWMEKSKKQENEIKVLSETVQRLKKELYQMEMQNTIAQEEANLHYQIQMKELLVKFNTLSSNSNDRELHFSNQYDCMNDLVNSHKSAIIKLKTSKETIELQNTKIEGLVNEISRLNVRAATQFNEFTPRPSFTELEELCVHLIEENHKNAVITATNATAAAAATAEGEQGVAQIKHKVPVMRFSDKDSVAKVKKITSVLTSGFTELKENCLAMKMNAENTQQTNGNTAKFKANSKGAMYNNRMNNNNNNMMKNRSNGNGKRYSGQAKINLNGVAVNSALVQPVGEPYNLVEVCDFEGEEEMDEEEQLKSIEGSPEKTRKRMRQKNAFEREVRKVARSSKLVYDENMSDHLSLDSCDRKALDGHSFEDIDHPFHDI